MKAASPPELRIVVLAAGLSRRLGIAKPLVRIRGLTLIHRTLGVVAPFAPASKTLVISAPRAGRVWAACRQRKVSHVVNPLRASGLASSVRLGLLKSRPAAGILLLPVDLAALTPDDIGRLIVRWRGARRRVVARHVQGVAGVPLIIPRWLVPKALKIGGELGLRQIVRNLPVGQVALVRMQSAEADVDTPQNLALARRCWRFARVRI